jgi:Tn7-like transposition protein D/TniQ
MPTETMLVENDTCLQYFPEPYKDEILYSICARFKEHLHLGGKFVSQMLFGYKKIDFCVHLPCYLGRLVSRIPIGNSITFHELITKHTMFPYHTRFLNETQRAIIRERMRLGIGGSTKNSLLKIHLPRIEKKFLMYCDSCSIDDRGIYGEAYWHRIHQAPGVFICPHHEKELFESTVKIYGDFSGNLYLCSLEQYLDESSENLPKCRVYAENSFGFLLRIARETLWLLSSKLGNSEISWLTNRYNSLLVLQGYTIPYMLRVKHSDLLRKAIYKRLTKEIQSILGFSDNYIASCSWLNKWLSLDQTVSYSFYHILMSFVLNSTLSSMISDNEFLQSFGPGPWVCMNRVSDHFKKKVIANRPRRLLFNISEEEIPKYIFLCNCGYSYMVSANSSTFDEAIVVTTGLLWDQNLVKLAKNSQKSLSDAVIELGVSQFVIEKAAKRLGISCWQYGKGKSTSNPKFGDDLNNLKISEYRASYLEILRLNPLKGRKALHSQFLSIHSVLLQFDRDWYRAHLPLPMYKTSVAQITYMVERDELLALQIPKISMHILSLGSKPENLVQVTSRALIEGTNSLRWEWFRYSRKFPKSKLILDSVKETAKDFQKRKLELAHLILVQDNHTVSSREIIVLAGLNKVTTNRFFIKSFADQLAESEQ